MSRPSIDTLCFLRRAISEPSLHARPRRFHLSTRRPHTALAPRATRAPYLLPSRDTRRPISSNYTGSSLSSAASISTSAASTSNTPADTDLTTAALLATLRAPTHYDLFPTSIPLGPPPNGPFTLDLPALRREFLQLQARAHPDRHAAAGTKRAAEAASARINEAYKTLGQPLARAEYLLRLRGAVDGGLEDEEAVVGDDDDDDEAMLLEVMEVRERAEEAETAEEVEVQRAENRVRMDEAVGVLEEAFARDELGRARREVVRLRYWVGVEDRLREGHGGH